MKLMNNERRIPSVQSSSPFSGRGVCVVNDLSTDEQVYLYEKARILKQAMITGDNIDEYRIADPSVGIYIIFLEDSTRTRESFINAAKFHGTRVNIFDASSSSFSKKESYSDTFNMLCSYNRYSIFVTRTKLEGVCRWLESSVGDFAERNGILRPAFINGGDGQHEHPTQEFLDEFTFLEQKNWNRDEINIALIGDLLHGRTVHSKVEGLKIFKNINADLIAPPEISMPKHYIDKMKENGFNVRVFESLDEYLEARNIADIWYFTRPQLERMGESILKKAPALRQAVTFKREYLGDPRLPERVKFYHPLPRHREYPTIPTFLDDTLYNGWERQSINGYYTRITLLSLLGGKLGNDFTGNHLIPASYEDDFIEEIVPVNHDRPEYKVGIKPIDSGIVIDHIERGESIETIWNHIDMIRKTLGLNISSSHGVYQSQKNGRTKGIISLPEFFDFDEARIKRLAAITPDCTLNLIREGRVIKKYRIHMPPRIYNFEDLSCKNTNCISHRSHNENTLVEFHRTRDNIFTCVYCDVPHHFKEIWE